MVGANIEDHNKRASQWYRDYHADVPSLQRFPVEILEGILEFLTLKSGRLMPITNRASLSVESFSSIANSLPEDSTQIRQFRLVCKRFADVGARRLFLRVRIRFSPEGFDALREIADREDLRGAVQQFSYMIPRFYPPDGTTLEDRLQEERESVQKLKHELAQRAQGRPILQVDRQPTPTQELRVRLRRSEANEEQLRLTLEKAQHQRQILKEETDLRTLVYALTKFTNLQQIRLMKVVDADDKWDKYLRAHPAVATEFRPFEWSYAYEHAATTLAYALQRSRSRVDRFSSRFMDPRTPVLVTQDLRRTISDIAERLICLEFEFRQTDVMVSLEQKMSQLSGLFQVVFNAAVDSLRSLHIGFTRPVSVPLRDVFHNLHLRKLQHIGLHMWQMSGDELLDLLRRHKNTLKSLRLRHILLRRNSMNDCNWRQVLQFIRRELRPKWVSLRGIDYEDDTHAVAGMHFVNGHAQNNGISDEDSDLDEMSDHVDSWSESNDEDAITAEDGDSDGVASDADTVVGEQDEDEQDESTDDSHESHESHDELDENESDLARDFQNISIAESSTPLLCGCENGYGWDDLDDDGISVTKSQWKRWEKWAIKPCSLCDPPIPDS